MNRTVFPTKPLEMAKTYTPPPRCHFCIDWATRSIVLFRGRQPVHLCRWHADELRTRLEEEAT